jgi:hypothetical protein
MGLGIEPNPISTPYPFKTRGRGKGKEEGVEMGLGLNIDDQIPEVPHTDQCVPPLGLGSYHPQPRTGFHFIIFNKEFSNDYMNVNDRISHIFLLLLRRLLPLLLKHSGAGRGQRSSHTR